MSGPTLYRWPSGKRCAAVLSFDFDGETPYLWNQRMSLGPILGELEQRRFGPRQGVHRVLDLLAELGLKASFYVPGVIAERYSDAVRRIAEEGHEIALHGYLHERVDEVSRAELEDTTARAIEALRRAGAPQPIGYRSPSWEMTRDALEVIQAAGVTYDSSLMGYDHPYWVDGLVEVPVQWTLDDAPFYRYVGRGDTRPPASPREVVESWRLELEGSRRYGGLFMLTMHPWLSGRAGRLLELEGLIRQYRDDPEIWWTTGAEVAEHHRIAHPADFHESPAKLSLELQ